MLKYLNKRMNKFNFWNIYQFLFATGFPFVDLADGLLDAFIKLFTIQNVRELNN